MRGCEPEQGRLAAPAGADVQAVLPARLAPPGLALEADDDTQAAAAWLRAKGARSIHTFDSYRREATRLLLWLSEQHLALADLKVDHVHRFFAHLASPPAHWIRPRKPRRGETLVATQVMIEPLSARSIGHSRAVLSQMCAYLRDAGWLTRNAFALSARPAVLQETAVTRWLDQEAWGWLWEWARALPRETVRNARQADRARWLLALLYHTGLRREEVAHARMGDFVRQDRMWLLRVRGKGHKERFVTINSALLGELARYRALLALPAEPAPGEEFPLVASVNAARRGQALTPRAVGLLVGAISRQAARVCPDEHIRGRIGRMTPHWLRHTNATHRLIAGASLETTQDELGHADPRTTRIYAKTSDARRREDAEKLATLGR